jgi:hypothetical protein
MEWIVAWGLIAISASALAGILAGIKIATIRMGGLELSRATARPLAPVDAEE